MYINDNYVQACARQGWQPLCTKDLGKVIGHLFPDAKSVLKRSPDLKKHVRYYDNLALIPNWEVNISSDSVYDISHVPHGSCILQRGPNYLKLGIFSSLVINGQRLSIELECQNNTFTYKIRGKTINHAILGLGNDLQRPSVGYLHTLIDTAKKIKICCGGKDRLEDLGKDCVRESVAQCGDENSCLNYVRCTSKCEQVVPWTARTVTCRRCQKALAVKKKPNCDTTQVNATETEVDRNGLQLDELTTSDLQKIIDHAFPTATEEMKTLLADQREVHLCKDKHGMRWDPKVVSTCLNMWVRSPRAYEDFKDSNMLILPSGRQLRRYKNSVKQTTGLMPEMLRWMKGIADDLKVPESGRVGILMHDECKIQQDLVLQTQGNYQELIGFVDMGEEAFYTEALKKKEVKRELATDALQIIFLGHTGFRFPVAHYAGKCAKANELYVVLWDVISALGEWGFSVDAVIQDGGEQNREFMHMLFPNCNPVEQKCCVRNITDLDKRIAISQDFSHCVKKLRNAILSSGVRTETLRHFTRHLKLNGNFIVWQQWQDAVKWDRNTNSRLIHRKITDSHLFPNQSEKMRNKLAEDMLNSDMLALMKAYQNSLKSGSHLDGAVSLLENTSTLIKIFKDQRAILSSCDTRLVELEKVRMFFSTWTHTSSKDKTSGSAATPSQQCMEDLQFLMVSFPEVCRMQIERFPGSGIVPSRFNTDLVENHFCQERGLHNGSLTHPNLATYSDTINSIVIGQTSKSRGRKANAGIPTALPYTLCTSAAKTVKKQKVHSLPRL